MRIVLVIYFYLKTETIMNVRGNDLQDTILPTKCYFHLKVEEKKNSSYWQWV